MTSQLIILVLALVTGTLATYDDRWLEQRLNHFDPAERRTWDMRYYAKSEHYRPGGPIFIYVGAGYEVYGDYLDTGLVHDIARDAGGYLFAVESRFYGQSRPTNKTSVESLQFMTMEQTVADLAYFIGFVKDVYSVGMNATVILFGKEIGASIAVWTRQKHPHLVQGVLASSAPLVSLVDNSELLVNVGQTIIDFGSQRCYDRIEAAFAAMSVSIENGEVDQLNEQFRLCTNLSTQNELEIASFKVSLVMVFAQYIQMSTPATVDAMCDSITDETREDPVAALAHWLMDDLLEILPCFEYSFSNIITEYSNIEWDTTASAFGGRQAYYIQCTQIPNYPTTSSSNQPFGDVLRPELFAQSCITLFGDLFNAYFIAETVDRKNAVFGGVNPAVRNVFFTNGEMDPMRTLGLLEDLNEDSPAVLIPATSRARDLGSINAVTDTEELTAVKRRSRDLIMQWLQQDME